MCAIFFKFFHCTEQKLKLHVELELSIELQILFHDLDSTVIGAHLSCIL